MFDKTKSPTYYNHLALKAMGEGRYEDAANHYQTAYELSDPEHREWYELMRDSAIANMEESASLG